MPVTVADAANPESVTVDMSFLDPITITENNPLQFGLLDVNLGLNQRRYAEQRPRRYASRGQPDGRGDGGTVDHDPRG
jgi:hypothetical protein